MKPKERVLLILLFVSTLALARQRTVFKYECPERCVCLPEPNDEFLIVQCKWTQILPQSFDRFPRNATKNLTVRCANSNSISTLGVSTFRGFSELRVLTISASERHDCNFAEFPAETFSHLDVLEILTLNAIGEPQIDDRVFRPLAQLKRLSITGSSLRQIPRDSLCPLQSLDFLTISNGNLTDGRLGLDSNCPLNRLVFLDLSGNRIRKLHDGDLSAFPALGALNLAANQLDEIEIAAISAQQLQQLNLATNFLRTAPALPDNLTHLNLADNRLEQIPATVANLERLLTLNVSRNDLDSRLAFPLLSNRLQELDLSSNRFDFLPIPFFERSIGSLKKLQIRSNAIAELTAGMFENFTSLQNLDLSKNQIKSLPADAFDGLFELTELRVADNSIYHVDIEAFRPLARRLQHLEMNGNQLSELPLAIDRLGRVKLLNFSNNQIATIHKFKLSKNEQLTHLDLSANRLERVESYVFAESPNLSELNLRANLIVSLNADAFEQCPQLRTLDLSENRLSTLNGALAAVASLRNLNLNSNRIKMLEWKQLPQSLSTLNAAANEIELLSAAEESEVVKLELQFNQIGLLLAEQLPVGLKSLNLSHNHLHHINNGTFAGLRSLKSMDLQRNRLVSFREETFPSAGTRENAVIHLRLLGNPLECNCETEWMKTTNKNRLTGEQSILIDDFEQLECRSVYSKDQFHRHSGKHHHHKLLSETKSEDFVCAYVGICEPSCICCPYTDCDCRSVCPASCKCYHDAKFTTNIVQCDGNLNGTQETHNEESEVVIDIPKLPWHATHIRIQNVRLPTLRSRDFNGRARLVELQINNTGLQTIEPEAFKKLDSLKSLSLVNNNLNRLTGEEAVRTRNLKRLDLSNNRFAQLEPVVAQMFPELEELRVNGNSLVDMPNAILQWPSTGRLSSVAIGMNPFRCGCRTQSDRFRAQAWLQANRDRVLDWDSVYCVENVTRAFLTNDTAALSSQHPNMGPYLFVLPMEDFLRDANQTFCTPPMVGWFFGGGPIWSAILIVIAIVSTALLFCAIVYLLCGFFRRTHTPMKKHRGYKKSTHLLLNRSTLTPPSPQPAIQYDIFVSYSHEDESEVNKTICRPLLEQNMSLFMLHQNVHQQAYTTNGPQMVSDELIRQMRSCQTLVYYLTAAFLENEWSTLAIRTAHKMFVQDRQRRVIVLLASDVDTSKVDPEMGQILRREHHILMHVPMWWNLFWSALPKRQDYCNGGLMTTMGGNSLDDSFRDGDNESETTQIYSDLYGPMVPSDVV